MFVFVNDIKYYSEVYRINDFVIDFVKYFLFTFIIGNIFFNDLCPPGKLGKNKI